MKLISIIIKIIELFSLADPIEIAELRAKADAWQKRAGNEDATTVQKYYHQLHQGITFELAAPFLFVFLKRWFDEMINGSKPEREDFID